MNKKTRSLDLIDAVHPFTKKVSKAIVTKVLRRSLEKTICTIQLLNEPGIKRNYVIRNEK